MHLKSNSQVKHRHNNIYSIQDENLQTKIWMLRNNISDLLLQLFCVFHLFVQILKTGGKLLLL